MANRVFAAVNSFKPGQIFVIHHAFMVVDRGGSNGMHACVNLNDGHMTEFEGRLMVEQVKSVTIEDPTL